MTYLPYRNDIETPEEGEQESIDGIIKGMTQEMQTVEKRQGRAVRASHAKSTACVIGELVVPTDLPPELAQGLFAKGGTYKVALRFAQGPGENLGDRVSTHRGMAIKVFGVEGEKLPGHDAPTQDFVFASGTTFPAGTAAGFLSQAKKIGMTTSMPEGVKSAASSIARNINKVLNAVTGGPSPTLDFYGHPFSHPLDDYYFSQCPIRYGDYVAKIGAFPVAPEQLALDDWQLDPHEDEDGFRHAAIDYFQTHDAVFELPLRHGRDDPAAAAGRVRAGAGALFRRGDDLPTGAQPGRAPAARRRDARAAAGLCGAVRLPPSRERRRGGEHGEHRRDPGMRRCLHLPC